MARRKMMKSLCRRAGITAYGFHALCHFMFSYPMDEEKVSLKTVSGLLRHKNVRTTEIYLQSIDTSKVAVSDKIEGKLTLKLAKPLQEAAIKEKGVDGIEP
jgi:integrase